MLRYAGAFVRSFVRLASLYVRPSVRFNAWPAVEKQAAVKSSVRTSPSLLSNRYLVTVVRIPKCLAIILLKGWNFQRTKIMTTDRFVGGLLELACLVPDVHF